MEAIYYWDLFSQEDVQCSFPKNVKNMGFIRILYLIIQLDLIYISFDYYWYIMVVYGLIFVVHSIWPSSIDKS